MSRLIVAASVFGFLASLAGCGSKSPDEDTSALENPPPKSPHCPDLPELANLRLNDGSIADVRIVQFRDTKLYFPAKIMKRQFVERWRDPKTGFIEKGALRNYRPDIHSRECPGVVHDIAVEKMHLEGVYPMIRLEFGDYHYADPQFRSDDLRFITYGLNPKVMTAHAKSTLETTQAIKFSEDIIISLKRVGLSTTVGEGRYESQTVLDLTHWLSTPPIHRDNNRKFFLKIDRVIKK